MNEIFIFGLLLLLIATPFIWVYLFGYESYKNPFQILERIKNTFVLKVTSSLHFFKKEENVIWYPP